MTNPRTFDSLAKVGAVIGALGLIFASGHFFLSYLTAFAFALTTVLGMLFFVLLHHAVDAGWSTVARRWAEQFLAALPTLGLLFVPVLVGLGTTYHWAGDDHLGDKAIYLNVPFFVARAALYFLVWIWLARRLRGLSLLQDENGDAAISLRLRRLAPVGLILFAITFTFAAVDWLMTIDHHWFSTIFGTYVFGEATLAALALLCLMAIRFRRGRLEAQVTGKQVHDLGKLAFAFAVFWGYIAYSQWFLIWYGNIPEETGWMIARWTGPWKVVTVGIVLALFVVPFVMLMRAKAKRHADVVTLTVPVILAGHYLGIYWLVMPSAYPDGPGAGHLWVDLGTLLFVVGVCGGRIARAFADHALYPVRDPRLHEVVPAEVSSS